mmetsp:Transcript_8511/g.7534  ORF Transcript_8511/g.7534 Transcript_8511/m.7534 type:complete len:108 (-) Transcript_8511:420-743(-)
MSNRNQIRINSAKKPIKRLSASKSENNFTKPQNRIRIKGRTLREKYKKSSIKTESKIRETKISTAKKFSTINSDFSPSTPNIYDLKKQSFQKLQKEHVKYTKYFLNN